MLLLKAGGCRSTAGWDSEEAAGEQLGKEERKRWVLGEVLLLLSEVLLVDPDGEDLGW